jgi:urea transport system permease protein
MPAALRLILVVLALAAPLAHAQPANPPAAAGDRATLAGALCAPGLTAQIAAVVALAEAGASGGTDTARWAREVVAAVEGRALRCAAGGVFIGEGADARDAATLQPAPTRDGATGLPVNNRLRAAAASAAAALDLFVEPLPAARARAVAALERRREALTVPILDAAAAAEDDDAVLGAIEALRARLLLDDPDPANRVRAIEAVAQTATLRNRTLIAGAVEAETDAAVLAAAEAALARIDNRLAMGRALATAYSGLSYASVLLLAALGLAIIFGLMGVINLAQGEFIMLGAYAAWFVQALLRAAAPGLLDWYLILALPVSFLAAALVGVAMEALVLRRLYDRPLMTLLATWAVSLLLVNLVRVTIGTQNLEFHQPFYVTGGIPVLGDFIVTLNRLFAIAVAGAALLGVVALLRLTTFGMNVRAVAQNRAMAGAAGIDARRTDRLAIALGSGLAGLAGVALAPLYNVNPTMGAGFIVDSFMVVVLGGVGSLAGAVAASFGIGQINVAIEPLYGAVAAKVVVLLLVIAFIQRRPEGLFAPKGRR